MVNHEDLNIGVFDHESRNGFSPKVRVAVRLEHKPTGIKTSAWSGRSQLINRDFALEVLEQLVDYSEQFGKTPLPGEIWQHHSGEEHVILEHLYDANTGMPMIQYKRRKNSGGVKWVHALSEFMQPGRFDFLEASE